jgi:uncharacterized protein (DUF58 family)
MRDFINPQILARLSALPLDARRPMAGGVSGRHRSQSRGSSLEFSEYRRYVPGDDTRRLDWRAWGRSDRYFIKEYEADTNLRLCLIVDVSGSMNFRSPEPRNSLGTKLDYARRLAGTLACLAIEQGDAVGLYCAGEQFQRRIAPKRSTTHLQYVLDELGSATADGPTGLPQALHDVAEQVARRALIVVISDLFVESAELQSCFQHLRFRQHDVAVFHLLDRAEVEFQFDRPTRFLDLEGSPPLLVDPATVAREYRSAVQQWLAELKLMTRNSEVDYRTVITDSAYNDVLAEFLVARHR